MTALAQPRHQVSRALAQVHALLDEITEASLWSMDPAETAATLVEATRACARVAELEARVASHATRVEVAERAGATSLTNWWAHATRQTHGTAAAKTRLAASLGRHGLVRDALAAGTVLVDQAAVIMTAVDALPDDVDPVLVEEAEHHLIGQAAHFDAHALRRLGKGLLHVIDPDAADAHYARLLEAEERAATQTTRLTLTDHGDGTTRLRGTLPTAQAQTLKKQLLAFAAPKHRAAVEGSVGERLPGPERLGRALCEWIERYPTHRLPDAGGLTATVVVTIPVETLLGGLEPGVLDTGTTISPGQARRLACEAQIIPMILDGNSQPLDLGRRRRFHTKAQRLAIAHRDQTCTADGCDWPPGLCHIHHNNPWAAGGPTSVKDGRLLCPKHHTRAHDPHYTTTTLPGGKVAFTRRT
ncbi:HNH endonuclease signature motif containing protein [Nocardioides sp. JS614]|uniref:HNH endonuclease signature motif containing protein n=2 Tax=unclassified Nocardioides TaxID=2615069 RepID=UPI0000570BF4|nr:HNH endonuclease signature motif containing protein [Nocardioides sp. JS614]ABL80977.1 HNH nuclease [Nocardioides sp. JS614]